MILFWPYVAIKVWSDGFKFWIKFTAMHWNSEIDCMYYAPFMIRRGDLLTYMYVTLYKLYVSLVVCP